MRNPFLADKGVRQRAKDAFFDTGDNTENALLDFNSILDLLRKRGSQADTRAGLSTRDLFGDQIDRNTNLIRANANQSKRALAGANSLAGGDRTGRLASQLGGTDQQVNEAVGRLLGRFENQATAVRERALNRGDQLANLLLSGQGNVLRLRDTQDERELQRRLAKRQNRSKLFGDILGLGGSIAGGILGE